MATSKTDLCNMALALVGESPLTDLTDRSKAGILVNSIYDQVERETFEQPDNWNFCTTRKQLSELTVGGSIVEPAMGWDHMYLIPTNYLRIINTMDVNADVITYRWRREVYISRGNEYDVLLSNETTCYVKCIVRRENTNNRPAWFNKLFYYDMAMILSKPLSRDDPRRSQLERMRIQVYNDAVSANGMEGSDTNLFREDLDRGHDIRSEVRGIQGFRVTEYT